MIVAAWTGWVVGLLHVVSGPDHLAAVAPLSLQRHRPAWQAGLRWGLGHGLGVGLVALLLLGLREALPLEALSSWSERLVGVLLLAVGVWAIRQGLKVQVHVHRHAHDGSEHEHVHVHAPAHAHPEPHPDHAEPLHPGSPPSDASRPRHRHGHAALGIGALHGLAGSSHFLGVLPTLALPDIASATAYIGGFGLGTVVAMTAFSAFIGWACRRWAAGPSRAYRGLLYASGSAALGVGGWWLWVQ